MSLVNFQGDGALVRFSKYYYSSLKLINLAAQFDFITVDEDLESVIVRFNGSDLDFKIDVLNFCNLALNECFIEKW
ncbi:hypothetical protein JXM83_06125 [Candidatus Woesearchaeota archaeon]|nr:hypothetical protein [Candidatus Woesearchaeota archaeon]